MKKVEVLIPFRVKGKLYKVGTKPKLPDEAIETLLGINPNMLIVLEDVKTEE